MKFMQLDIQNENSIEKLKEFYKEVLIPNFDVDELETYEQIIERARDFEEDGSYFIQVVLDENENVLGGIVYDYFKDTNSGFIEYIATNGRYRQKGVGSKLLEKATSELNKIATSNGLERIDFLAGEVEKQINGKQAKHYFWEKYGFKPLNFKYIQPPLDENKAPVEIMQFGIMTKAPNAHFTGEGLSVNTLKSVVEDYIGEHEETMKKVFENIDKNSKNGMISFIDVRELDDDFER